MTIPTTAWVSTPESHWKYASLFSTWILYLGEKRKEIFRTRSCYESTSQIRLLTDMQQGRYCHEWYHGATLSANVFLIIQFCLCSFLAIVNIILLMGTIAVNIKTQQFKVNVSDPPSYDCHLLWERMKDKRTFMEKYRSDLTEVKPTSPVYCLHHKRANLW